MLLRMTSSLSFAVLSQQRRAQRGDAPPVAKQRNTRSAIYCALRRAHIAQRKSGDAPVLLAARAQLVLGDELVETVERPVAHRFLDPDVDEIGRVRARARLLWLVTFERPAFFQILPAK
jgi:hypothetical protein